MFEGRNYLGAAYCRTRRPSANEDMVADGRCRYRRQNFELFTILYEGWFRHRLSRVQKGNILMLARSFRCVRVFKHDFFSFRFPRSFARLKDNL